ncbi:hypothetical protein [Halocalculus aciditolerans]|uniref:Uncharacterized protein n=1 Tax=Halocalculus aciditolerans TaxID=1383812 RepID=A0A830FJ65_9EURY|nr:hypothetical protein [Halocalculus aciditolerans]GGL60248.1 hypothetical protein GCM10009039_18150 [Halocalculus aciditolerans]
MSQGKQPSWDDLSEVSSGNDDEEYDDVLNLDPGDSVVAEVRAIERDADRYGRDRYHLTRTDGEEPKYVSYFASASVTRPLDNADVGPGDVIGIKKDEDSYTFEDEDGEEQEAYGFEVRVLDGDT